MTNLRLQEAERASKLFSKSGSLSNEKEDQFFDSSVMGSSNVALNNILKEDTKKAEEAPAVVTQIPDEAKWDQESDEISLGDDDIEETK